MTKYEPLKVFLRKQGNAYVNMTFSDIERIIGAPLPYSSKVHRAWWSNNPSNNVMTKEWLAAGFQTEQVDIGGEKLVFRRVRKTVPDSEGERGVPKSPDAVNPDQRPQRRSIFGCMKGTLTLLPGVDLTEPTDPDLADWIDRKYGRQ